MDNQQLKKLQNEELDILKLVVSFCNDNNLKYYLIGGTLLGGVRHNGFIPWDDDIDIAMPRKDYEVFKKTFKNTKRLMMDSYKTNKKYWLPFIKIRLKNTCYLENAQANYSGEKGIWIDIFPLDNGSIEIIDKMRFRMTMFLRHIVSIKMGLTNKNDKGFKKGVIKMLSLMPKGVLVGIQNAAMAMGCKNSRYYVNLGSQYGFLRQRHLKTYYGQGRKQKFENETFLIPEKAELVLTKIYGKNYMTLPPIEKRVTHNPSKIVFEDGETIEFNEQK